MANEDRPALSGVTSSVKKERIRQEPPDPTEDGIFDALSMGDADSLAGGPNGIEANGADQAEQENDTIESALESAIHTLIAAVRQESARERKRERENLMHVFQQRVHQLEIDANRKVREKLVRARERDRAKLEERSRRLDTMFAQLNRLAREVAEQKQALQKSRKELEAKLVESDLIQSELRDIGLHLGEQIETFGDSLPDDSFIEQFEPKRQAGGG